MAPESAAADDDDDPFAPSDAPVPGGDRYPLSLPRNPVLRALKLAVGRFFSRLDPFHCTRLLAGQFEWPLRWRDRCILSWQGQRVERDGCPESLEPVHRRFWSGRGGMELLSRADRRYREMFLHHHQVIVPELQKAIVQQRCRALVELGCGRGDVLAHLSRTLNGRLRRYVGVDLSEPMTALNRRRFARTRLRFDADDAVDWVLREGVPRMAYLSYGGVLEFLPRARLEQLFHYVAAVLQPSVFGLVEPLSDEHDLEADDFSHAWGDERSLSHNYPSLLRAAGFEIRWQSQMRLGTQRWLLLVAESPDRAWRLD